MTFFLDGPAQAPLRRAEDIRSKPPTAAAATSTAKREEARPRPVAATSTATRTAAPAAAMEDDMGNTSGQGGSERIRDALRTAYPLAVSFDDLVEAYGGPRTAARTRINQMARGGEVKKLDGQLYKWAGELDPRPAKARPAPPPAREEEDDDQPADQDDDDRSEADDEEPAASDDPDDEQPGEPEEDPADPEPAELAPVPAGEPRPVRVRFVSFEVEGDLEAGELASLFEQLRAAVQQG